MWYGFILQRMLVSTESLNETGREKQEVIHDISTFNSLLRSNVNVNNVKRYFAPVVV